jgi:hypothetical protein
MASETASESVAPEDLGPASRIPMERRASSRTREGSAEEEEDSRCWPSLRQARARRLSVGGSKVSRREKAAKRSFVVEAASNASSAASATAAAEAGSAGGGRGE